MSQLLVNKCYLSQGEVTINVLSAWMNGLMPWKLRIAETLENLTNIHLDIKHYKSDHFKNNIIF